MPQSEQLKEHFDQLYRDYYVKVYRLSLGLANRVGSDNPADRLRDAEDITQEAFLRAFRSFQAFREDSSFFTWICRIAVNVAHDYMRQRAKLPIYEVLDRLGCSEAEVIDPNPDNNPESKLLANEVMRVCMLGFTECLPLDQKKAFFLVAGLALPYKLAAEILDCSVSALKSKLHRAKGRLASYMESRCSIINKSNTCRCEHWVKGFAQDPVMKECIASPTAKITIPNKVELYLRDLLDIYRNVYHARSDEAMAELLKEGFAKKKWSTFA